MKFNSNFWYVFPTNESMGAGLIMSTEKPFFLMRINKYSDDDSPDFNKPFPVVQIEGYNIALQYAGALDRLPVDFDAMKAKELIEMAADWYYKSEILRHPKKYKRFLLQYI